LIIGGAQYLCGNSDQGFDGRFLKKSHPRNQHDSTNTAILSDGGFFVQTQ
jgi:hypothetical protein